MSVYVVTSGRWTKHSCINSAKYLFCLQAWAGFVAFFCQITALKNKNFAFMANLIERSRRELLNTESKTETAFFSETLPDVIFAKIIIHLQCILVSFFFFVYDCWSREGFLIHMLILIYICMIYINI